MSSKVAFFIFAGAVLVAIGLFGYLIERRRRQAVDLRRFLVWYGLLWVFVPAAVGAMLYPRLHWLYYVVFASAVANYAFQIVDRRRVRGRFMVGAEDRKPRRRG